MNPANPANPAMGYMATCQACGAHGLYPTGGLIWFVCAICGWSGQLQTIPTPGAASAPSSSSASQHVPSHTPLSAGAQPTAQPTAQPSWMAHVPPVPPLVSLPDPTSYNGGLVNPGGDDTSPPLTLPEALAGDARLYGEEIALALLDRGGASAGVSVERDCSLSLPQVWDRLQEAQGALFEALGGRHMGDYTPDLEPLMQALVGVGVWHIIALQVVGQMSDDVGGDSGDAA